MEDPLASALARDVEALEAENARFRQLFEKGGLRDEATCTRFAPGGIRVTDQAYEVNPDMVRSMEYLTDQNDKLRAHIVEVEAELATFKNNGPCVRAKALRDLAFVAPEIREDRLASLCARAEARWKT